MKNFQKTKKILNRFEKMILVGAAALYSAAPALAQTGEWTGVCVAGDANDVATIQGLECLIANVFSIIISLIGLAAFVMFIIGSIRWMLSGSSADGTKKAKDTMTHAVLGIVIALSAFIVLNLISGFTGVVNIIQFIIPTS